jgi:putative nucleotidyltransferase with HDIG domain
MFHRTELLLNEASALEKAGQWQSAAEVFERIFDNTWRSRDMAGCVEVLLRLGLLYSTQGDGDSACDYFELSLSISELHDDVPRASRALNSLGAQLHRSGDLDGAESYYLRAQHIAKGTGDSRTRGDIEVNLGIVDFIRGELRDALIHYKTALREYEDAGLSQRMAMVLNNLGMLYTDLADYASAAEILDRAITISRELGDLQVEGIVQTNRTELLLALGDLSGARTSCDEAFEISSKLGNSELKAEALKSYGVIYRETAKPHLAEAHFNQAIQLAAEIGNALIEADANRELALVLRSSDRNREALDALNRSHALFTALQAKHEQAEIDKRFKQLETDFLTLVARWGESIEAKDRYTRGHCQRVADYACEIAARSGLSERDLVWFRMGAFLHDLGKTEVPAEILNKPGRLTDEERRIIEHHTVAGDEILSEIEFPWDIRPMVRSHHERWDGKGYPDGLCGDQIPHAARILHIADVFDALTTTRSYRAPLSRDAAFELMESDITSFDPELFELFRSILPVIETPTE